LKFIFRLGRTYWCRGLSAVQNILAMLSKVCRFGYLLL